MSGKCHDRNHGESNKGFTLIEVLVVVAIIALLVAILLPSLAEARRDARAVQCAANQHHLGQAIAIYTNRYQSKFPASYLYPYDEIGNYRLVDQGIDKPKPYGYLHWSYFLYSDGRVDEKAFQCPELDKGGHPRTNPGDQAAFAGNQIDDSGGSGPGQIEDKQATWIAYTGNAAIFPRNKFTPGGKNDRYNVFVNESSVRNAGGTILATEFAQRFEAVSQKVGGGRVSKSHRPIHPFYDRFIGAYDPYASGGGKERPGTPPPFTYGTPDEMGGGVMTVDKFNTLDYIIDDLQPINKVNAVGRHHPGGGLKQYGGTANFLYADSHVDRKNVLDTIAKKEWGDKFYSLSGDNRVEMSTPVKIPGGGTN